MEKEGNEKKRLVTIRILAIVTIIAGLNYIIWRFAASLNLAALWFALPVAIAECYGIGNMLLFAFMAWKKPERRPLPPIEDANVDVFITTYNESVDLVRGTVRGAMAIDWPHKKVYLLDDGARQAMRTMAEECGCGYITRGEEWSQKPRHAKAGNVNNALLETGGDFILLLDADQIPAADILRKTLGYFRDEHVAFVQTPQFFYNLPPGDPFGNEASFFYGPIQQGKDAWNASFFCGSNAVLRREALMQLGVKEYVETVEKGEREAIAGLIRSLKKANCEDTDSCVAMESLMAGLREAKGALDGHVPLQKVSDLVGKAMADAEFSVSKGDLAGINATLAELAAKGDLDAAAVYRHLAGNLEHLADQFAGTALDRLGLSKENIDQLNLGREDEALPVQALATISVTEDMATAMRLHALGWTSVFHHEVLAYGLAPEDFGSSIKQRLRWAQGTIQVFLRENPFSKKGLSLPQKLMYFSTMYSYLSGFFNLVLLLAPVVYFFTAIPPVRVWSFAFFVRFIPFFVLNKLMFRYVAAGIPTWRSEQYEVAMFALDIKAVLDVLFRRNLPFVVTPKGRQNGNSLRLIWPQSLVITASIAGMVFGIIRYIQGSGMQLFGLIVNIIWSIYNISLLSVVIWAFFYKDADNRKTSSPIIPAPQEIDRQTP